MRTARALTVSPSMLFGGGVCSRGGGVCPQGGVCSGGVCSRGGVVSQHAVRQTPPLWTESQMPVKTLPCPNFVAGGNNRSLSFVQERSLDVKEVPNVIFVEHMDPPLFVTSSNANLLGDLMLILMV